ncbi:glutamate-rich protein 5 isoform X2 [Cyanistes caeruleus]|uniref:glutamate-rich protein 5 isoform X2 n=1 Tax=Cyanistes caeruleus TaxID=156563 RepID=UPI000CDA93B8|nr:glutamate-rich protein 5 isoform X2 [Cyanistes caeruleus]
MGKTESVSKREEPEGTEPLPAGEEESSELPSVWREESKGPLLPAPGEDAGAPSPGPAEDSGLVEGSDSSVVEIVEKVHTTEEDHLIEEASDEEGIFYFYAMVRRENRWKLSCSVRQ